MLKLQSPDVEETQPVVAVESENRRITMSPFVEHTPETVTSTQPDTTNVETPEIEAPPVPEVVPSAESSDDEIREFQTWLASILVQEDTIEEIEQENFSAEDNTIDYDIEESMIKSVIENRWKNSLETYDIEGYMSAIWEDSFFYASDMGTPDDLNDDLIFRSGGQEREGALNMFGQTQNIDLNLYQNGGVEFLSETLAMVDYNYELKLVYSAHGVSYPSGRMIFIVELRENGEWRILEWYDYATPGP